MNLLKLLILVSLTSQLHAKPCKKITNALRDLYPHHSKDMILTRVDHAKDTHKFIRGFIPYYYDVAWDLRKELPVHKKMKNTTGHVVGDAHVENFGFMINNDGKPLLALNDFDDVAEAPLYLDVLRLSQSASYMDDVKQAKVLAAYKKGLTEAPYEFSNFINKLKEKAIAGGINCKAEYASTKDGLKFTVKGEPNFVTSQSEMKNIEKVLKDKFGPKALMHDSYKTMKESGGSAYGSRFHILAEFDGNVHFIEFKEVFESGVVSQFAKTVPNDQRILTSRNVFLGNNFDQKLDVIKVEDKMYQLRFKSEGNKSIDFGKIKDKKEIHKVIEDEFFVLGQLHRKSLDNSPEKIQSYMKDLNSVSMDDWKESIDLMKQKMKKAFKKVKD
jgi:hypothetical protein